MRIRGRLCRVLKALRLFSHSDRDQPEPARGNPSGIPTLRHFFRRVGSPFYKFAAVTWSLLICVHFIKALSNRSFVPELLL